ncbi:GNAT family protein [Enterococcus faecalis]|uniref:GNAT family N-acetyltransferase n=1 Tax=Enterococcus faecalis TaxID=1351 RepID=UPI00288D59BE|nr:GNAT family protein [Enterococcus faecalis]
MSLICKFAFYELGLHKIRLAVNSNNQKAIHVYEKVGFKKEGIDREALFQDGWPMARYLQLRNFTKRVATND